MKTFRAEPANDEIYRLGEGPVWDSVRAELLWVDIDAGEVLTGDLHNARTTGPAGRVSARPSGPRCARPTARYW